MMQPSAIIAAGAEAVLVGAQQWPRSPAGRSGKPPSVRSRTRDRRPLSTSARWDSARPSSHGRPACLIDDSGLAPVPPFCPLMWTTSARALTQPAATVPTPSSATSFTDTSAALTCLRS